MAKRILFVEDEAFSRKQIAFLREEGYLVQEAKDGVEAIELLNNSHFDLVLSDIRMPRVDGMAVIAHLRSISEKVPFILLTGHPDDAAGMAALPRGILMTKPVVLEDLKVKIRRLLEW